jgi:predicted phosphodiesterase
MRFVCISDTHGTFPNVPEGDVLIHAGDATFRGTTGELKRFRKWMKSLPHEIKIFVPGNHELTLDSYNKHFSKYLKSALAKEVYLLVHKGITIATETGGDVKLQGCSYQPYFNNWAFNIDSEEERAQLYRQIFDDTEILVTHCPPYGILDSEPYDYGPILPHRMGCKALMERVKELKQLKVHIFGHIHESYGIKKKNGVLFINAAQMNKDYQLTNKPIVFDYVNGKIKLIDKPSDK